MLILKASKSNELFVSDLEGLVFTNKEEWRILYLNRSFHYKLLGWDLKSPPPKDHPNYLIYFEENEGSVNIVNGDASLFNPIGVQGLKKCLDFIEQGLNNGKKVCIACSTGKHLSNTLAFLYLSKRSTCLSTDYWKSLDVFSKYLPSYKPSKGFEDFLYTNWHLIE